jgi:hypothetical protein
VHCWGVIMKVFLTAISECDKKGFIEDTIRVANLNGQNIKHFSMGDMLMEKLKSRDITFIPKNILNIPERERARDIEGIIREIKVESEKYDNVIISGHAKFYWKGNYTNAFDWSHLNVLNPDMYISLIDNTDRIKESMDLSGQFKSQNVTKDDILAWQNNEVDVVTGWSQFQQKQHYILPRHESQGLLYKIMFRPEIELVYASFPMSHIEDKDKELIDKFVNGLNEYFAVITPRSVELSKEFTHREGAQTVLRDEKWFAGKARKIIVYFMPHKPTLPFSAGVWTEVLEGQRTTKEILGLFPEKNYGPFEKYYLDAIFNSEEQFFNYIESKEGGEYRKHNIKYKL